jgi:amino acid transporter
MINFVILFVLVICFIVMGLAIFLMSREKQRKNYTVKFIMITIFIFLGIIIYLFFYINPQVNIQEVYFDEPQIVNNEIIIHGIFRFDWDSYQSNLHKIS